MTKYSLHPHKRWGQSFLVDDNIIDKAMSLLPEKRYGTILEIGPGLGSMTRRLIGRTDRLIAVEIDRGICRYLNDEPKLLGLTLLNEDFLSFDPQIHCRPDLIIGNIPYSISTEILFKLIDYQQMFPLTHVYLLVQKEVADRLCAAPGNKTYGIPTVLLGNFFSIKPLFQVAPSCFYPPPHVRSIFLTLIPRENPRIKSEDYPHFRRLVKTLFNERRKQIRNTIKQLDIQADRCKTIVAALEGSFGSSFLDSRPESLCLEVFAEMFAIVKKQGGFPF